MAARNISGVSAPQKEFVKLFDTLTGAYNRWQVWNDMVWMFAATIANTIRTPHWRKREDEYLKIINRYDEQQRQVFPDLFAMLVQTMDDSVKAGRYGDFLGEIFMQDQHHRRLTEANNHRWSERELANLRIMLERGATYVDLKREFNRSTAAIRRKIYDLYLPRPKRSVAVPWAEEDHYRLVEMVDAGWSIECCADALDRSPEAVRWKIGMLQNRGMWEQYRR